MAGVIEVPVAIGELIDKLTILEIKIERFVDPGMVKNAAMEYGLLRERRVQSLPQSPILDTLTAKLKAINERIWALENDIREFERNSNFGSEFITVARSIYQTNDERAAVKRQINLEFRSKLIEEKSYARVDM